MARIRKLRHYKQRFKYPDAEFIFRRSMLYGGVMYQAGDRIPALLQAKPAKLRRFWEARRIELAEFEAKAYTAAGDVVGAEPSAPVFPTEQRGSWFYVQTPDGERRVQGHAALADLLAGYGAQAGAAS